MHKTYLLTTLAIMLSLSGCYKQSVQGSYATPNKQVEGIALGLTASTVLGPVISGASTLGAAATGAHIGNMGSAIMKRRSLMNSIASQGIQIIAQGDKLRFILSVDQFFKAGTPTLNPQEYPALDYMAALLKEYNGTLIKVSGYTDNIIAEEQAQKLSKQQAESVLGYLWVHGISYQSMTAQGYGVKHPIANNDTLYGRAANRRIELHIIQ